MSEHGEYSTAPVPDDQTVGWARVGIVAAMVAFSLPTFLTGVEVAIAAEPAAALIAILAGNLLLSGIGGVCGAIGARTRLSSYMLVRIAFGRHGAALVNLAFAVSLLGWFGVNIDLFGEAVQRLLADETALAVPEWLVEAAAGTVMTVTTVYGFRAINMLSAVLVPVLIGVTGLLLLQATDAGFADRGIASEQLSFGDAMSTVVGAVIIGAIILPDITRFIRHWRGGVYTAFLCYLVVGSIVQIAGGMAALAFADDDLLNIMILIGLGWAAFAIIIAGSWVLNSLNLYSASLSFQATFEELQGKRWVAVLGVLGTLAAFADILDYFQEFLFYLAIIFTPVAGVIAVDYLWMRQGAYHGDREEKPDLFNWIALAAWAIGAFVALLGVLGFIRISGVAALDAIVAAAVFHTLAHRFDTRAGGST